MNIYKYDIVFQEIPHHISLAFYVCGCPLKCSGCHSPELWTEKNGYPLNAELFIKLVRRYKDRITCVLFMGGEWHEGELIEFLQLARAENLLTGLYTGLEAITPRLEKNLDFVKIGPWRQELGGLSSPRTNQVLWDLRSNIILNELFQNNSGGKHDSSHTKTDSKEN